MSGILLLEDDDALAMAIEFNLVDEGFSVSRVGTVKEAKEKFSEEFQMVLLDVMLPDGSGYDVCKYIREKSNVPIIFLTACDDEVNVVLGLEIGADDYITKPFRAKELITRMKANIRRYKLSSGRGIIKSGDLEVNINSCTCSINGENLSLTPAEYKLLLIFLKNPMNVLSKSQLLDSLYDYDMSLVDDKTLAVYIRRLREKIELDSSSPKYIVNKRGLGYIWNKNVTRH